MSNIAVHIERVLSGVVAVDANVIFENIVFFVRKYYYNTATGEITFNEPG